MSSCACTCKSEYVDYGRYSAGYTQICTDSKRIEDRKRAISQLWDSLRNTIDLRSMSLAVAKEIHTFDRDSTDVKERVQV